MSCKEKCGSTDSRDIEDPTIEKKYTEYYRAQFIINLTELILSGRWTGPRGEGEISRDVFIWAFIGPPVKFSG